LPVGDQGLISNVLWIFGENDSRLKAEYEVGDMGVGVGAGSIDFKVFKTDSVGNPLRNAQFSLYVTDLGTGSYPTIPPGGLAVVDSVTLTAPGGEVFRFGAIARGVMTDAAGVASFSDEWLLSTPSYRLLYLLIEDQAPYGFGVIGDGETFFTLNPTIDTGSLATISGKEINQLADFITIENHLLEPGDPETLRIRKLFSGLTDMQIQQHLQNFKLVVTDPLGIEYTFDLTDALDPFGIVLPAIQGTYFIREINANVPGFTWTTNPPFINGVIRFNVIPNEHYEVLFAVDNIYTPIPPIGPPPDPNGPYPPGPPITPPGPPTTPPLGPPTIPLDPPEPPTAPAESTTTDPSGDSPDMSIPRTDATHQTAIYIFLMMLSMITMVGISVFERRKKYFL